MFRLFQLSAIIFRPKAASFFGISFSFFLSFFFFFFQKSPYFQAFLSPLFICAQKAF